MFLLSKSEIPSPKRQIQNRQAWGRGGCEAAAATLLLTRVRPSACVGLAQGSPEVGWGPEREGSELFNSGDVTNKIKKDPI
jgi:hypothetical protein